MLNGAVVAVATLIHDAVNIGAVEVVRKAVIAERIPEATKLFFRHTAKLLKLLSVHLIHDPFVDHLSAYFLFQSFLAHFGAPSPMRSGDTTNKKTLQKQAVIRTAFTESQSIKLKVSTSASYSAGAFSEI